MHVETFKCVGLTTNTKKMQTLVCTLGKIRLQLPTDSYKRLREGVVAGEESEQPVVCHVCKKNLHARSLPLHLASIHDIYLQVVVADDLPEERAGIRYKAERVRRKMPINTLGNLAAHTCCAGTSEIFTQKTPLRSHGKDTTHDASGAGCSAIQNTPDTSNRRCVRRG